MESSQLGQQGSLAIWTCCCNKKKQLSMEIKLTVWPARSLDRIWCFPKLKNLIMRRSWPCQRTAWLDGHGIANINRLLSMKNSQLCHTT